MSKKMWLLLASVGVVAFIGGYGATANAWHGNWHGYFFGTNDTNGLEVLPPWGGPSGCAGNGWALPSWVDTPSEFINFTVCKLGGNTQNRRGAAFIISTMSGMKNVNPGSAEINEFAARVNYAASRGWINFGASVGCVLPNTYYQDAGSGDVARYSGCGSGPGNAVTFWNGSSSYIIKRFCANPLGSMPVLADDINFNMSGATSLNDTTVLPNQQIFFSHNLTNGGPTGTGPYSISWTTQSATSSGGPWSNVASGNAGTFSSGQTKLNIGNQTVTVPANAVPNSQICRRITWSPDTHGGGSGASTPRCATVQYNYTLTPNINVAITGVDGPVVGNIAEPGDSATFTYAVNNTGTTQSQTVTCTYNQATHTGYSTAAPTTSFTPSGANCAPTRVFPVGNTPVASETVNNLPANRSVCRSLGVGPSSFGNTMPSGWSSQDIGSPGVAGSTSAGGGTFTVQASGSDIWNASDQFRYAYRSLSGNGEIIARVASLGNTDPWAKAGVMIRNTLAADSNHTFMMITPGNGTNFQRRIGVNNNLSTSGPATGLWVRLVRSGSTFTAYSSSNGSTWTTVGSQSLSMNSNVYVGLAATSHNNSVLTQAIFDNVSFNGVAVTSGGVPPAQSCVHVAAKPYARVYGGDVSAGGGLVASPDTPADCSLSPWAAVIGWNRRSAGGWSGAGVQFAAYAMRNIFDTATGLGSGSGPPHNVAFANTGITPTVSTANGRFGGMFGSAACVQDHYSTRPASPTGLTSPFTLTGLGSGSYSATGNVRLTATTINPGQKVTLYVDGNLYIDGNLRYAGSGTWTSGNIPMLRIIVLGNIFIDNDVQFLDGLYVAQQRNATTDGIIYTCTSGTAPGPYAQPTLDGSLGSMCDNKLTVNGGFVARRVMLLRTIGTLRASGAGETAAGGNMAEAFNYNPAMWMSQPTDTSGAAIYDAINSLPPIL